MLLHTHGDIAYHHRTPDGSCNSFLMRHSNVSAGMANSYFMRIVAPNYMPDTPNMSPNMSLPNASLPDARNVSQFLSNLRSRQWNASLFNMTSNGLMQVSC